MTASDQKHVVDEPSDDALPVFSDPPAWTRAERLVPLPPQCRRGVVGLGHYDPSCVAQKVRGWTHRMLGRDDVYNLLVGFTEGVADRSRVGEHTDSPVLEYVAPDGQVDLTRLVHLPTLVMPEIRNSRARQVARVGHVEDLTVFTPKQYRFRFVANPEVPEFSTERIVEIADRLQITEWEFTRTHWAVKDVDLYRELHESITGIKLTPRVFRFPTEVARDPNLVAVMMPFDERFRPVYQALREAVTAASLECRRADDIWDNDHIMDDVISLIWRARVVISDLSMKNPNVFYETGIAHSLGRDVIQIAQSRDDVPFDVGSLRSILYLANNEGLADLKHQVTTRLNTLLARG